MFQPTPEQRALVEGLPRTERDLLAAARALEYRGDEPGAAALLGLAVQRAPSETLRTAHGNLLFRLQRFQHALITLIPILKSSPHHQQTLILVCECLIEVAEYERAQNLIAQARATGVAPPVVANLQNLLTTRRMGLSQRSDASQDSTMEQSLLAENFLPMADSASTYQESINDETAALEIDWDTGLLSDYTEQVSGPPPHLHGLPTATAPPSHDVPTLAASPDLYQPIGPSDEEPTKAFSRSEALSRVQQRAQQDIHDDVTFDAHGHRTRALGDEESFNIQQQYQGAERTRSMPPDAIPFGGGGQQPGHRPQQQQQHRPQQAQPQAPADESMPMLGNPSLAARFSMPDNSMETEKSDLQVGVFGNPSDLFSLSAEDAPKPIPRGPSFQNEHHAQIPEASDAPSFGARPAIGGPAAPSSRSHQPAQRQGAPARNFSEDSLQLDMEPNQLEEISSVAEDQRGRQRTRKPSLDTQASASPEKKQKNTKVAKVILGVLFILTVASGSILGMLYGADHSLMKQLDERTLSALANIREDSFQGRKAGYNQLVDALGRSSFLGDGIDNMIAGELTFLPGLKGSTRKHRLLGDLALLSASLEYQYGKPGSFEANEHIKAASDVLGKEHPQVIAAMAYTKMSEDPLAALEQARAASAAKPGDLDLLLPVIDALLASRQPAKAWQVAQQLRESSTLSLRQQKYVGRAAFAVGEDALPPLKAALKMTEDDHLDVNMIMIQLTNLPDGEANKVLRSLENAREDEGSYPDCTRAMISQALAAHYSANAEIKKARSLLTEAEALCSERPEPSLALIDFMIKTGQSNAAQSRIQKLSKVSKSPMITFLRADLALLHGEPRAALEILEQAPDALPAKAMLQGDAALQMQDYTRAQKYYEAVAKEEDPRGVAEAHAMLTRVLAAPAHINKIDKELDKLIDKHPNSAGVLHAGARVKALAAQQEENNSKRKDLQAQSDKRFSQALAASEFDAPIFFDRCRVFARRGALERAYGYCQDAHKLVEDNVPGEVTRADVMAQMGKTDESIRALESLDNLTEHENITVRVALARTLLLSDRAEQAQKLVDALKSQAPDDPRVILLLGLHAFHSERYVQAYSQLKRAKELAPTNTEAAVFFAYAQVRVNKLEEATEPLKKHLSDPVWGGYAWLALGELRRRQERFEDAEENLQKATTLLTESNAPTWFITEAYLQRALAWTNKKGWQDNNVAAYLSLAASRGNENHAGLNYVRAIHTLYQRKPDQERALAYFDLALEAQADHCPTLEAMPATLRAVSKDDRAKEIEELHKKQCKN